jgi:putative tricarboxylic transport membrane protein
MTRHQISGSALALLGLATFIITPYQVHLSASGTFPRIISAFLFILGVLVALTSKEQEEKSSISLFDPLLLISLVLILGTIIAIRIIGFYPSILLSLPLCLILFGERNFKKIVLFSLVTTGIIYCIMNVLLGCMLP